MTVGLIHSISIDCISDDFNLTFVLFLLYYDIIKQCHSRFQILFFSCQCVYLGFSWGWDWQVPKSLYSFLNLLSRFARSSSQGQSLDELKHSTIFKAFITCTSLHLHCYRHQIRLKCFRGDPHSVPQFMVFSSFKIYWRVSQISKTQESHPLADLRTPRFFV